jgi:hypothetical protein
MKVDYLIQLAKSEKNPSDDAMTRCQADRVNVLARSSKTTHADGSTTKNTTCTTYPVPDYPNRRRCVTMLCT